jgi:hypothetical protein
VKKDSISIPTGEKVSPVRNSSRALNTAGIILKSNPSTEQRGNISNRVKGENKISAQEESKNTPTVPPVMVNTPHEKESKPKDRMKVEDSNPVTQSPERKALSNMNQNRSGRIEQSSSNKENLGQRNLISSSPKDKATVKSSNPVTQSPQRNALVNPNQNRIEKAGQPNSFTSLPTRQEGKASAERASLPEGRSSPAPTTKEQTSSFNPGSTGGFLGTSPMRFSR